jgi:hypothetical protein
MDVATTFTPFDGDEFAIVRGNVCRLSRRFLPIAGYLTGRGIDRDAVNKVDL